MKRILKRLALSLLVLFGLIQLKPVHRENPPVSSDLVAPADVKAILRRACYDCHSNETNWPWYAYVAPVSWLVQHDVEEGRGELNFSIWGNYDAGRRLSKASSALEEIDEGRMPLAPYLALHADAKLSPEDVAALKKWVDGLE
ncbi:MAG: heme-binding domain-containing protein [Planctomycetes bacterium]|nr:heme-binding domain-containing protein [Planctomycetota bacterium]